MTSPPDTKRPTKTLSPVTAAALISFAIGLLGGALPRILGMAPSWSALFVVGSALLAVLIARAVEKQFRSRLERIEDCLRVSEQESTGVLIPPSDLTSDMLSPLISAVNSYGKRVDEELRTTRRNLNSLKRVLKSMREGVLTIDSNERLIKYNAAASQILGLDRDTLGRSVTEVVRNSDFQETVREVLRKREKVSGEVILEGEEPIHLEVHATPLPLDPAEESSEALVVLHDVSKLKRLERVRKDFVANVSHELRTPVTSISGFVETLLDGAVDNPDDARRFLEIIDRQASRLEMIIEELLLLSNLESKDERIVTLDSEPLVTLIDSAVEVTTAKAEAKGVTIQVNVPADLNVRVRVPLLEQAFVNLIDNAIKYSPENEAIEIESRIVAEELQITVRDRGPGIEEMHQERLFERFYRIDKARTRKQGGTGLGLAIVKHIAQVHGGRASLESSPGSGSAFIIHLPITLVEAKGGESLHPG